MPSTIVEGYFYTQKKDVDVMPDEHVQQILIQTDHERRLAELENDMKTIKPIVYDTSNSVKQIEKSVEKMEKNSDKIRGYFLLATIGGVVGIMFLALQNSIFGG